MYWTKIQLVGASFIDLPQVGASPSDIFQLKDVTGLDPSEIAVTIVDVPPYGGVFQNRRPANKQITIIVGLAPDYTSGQTSSDLREILYGLLTPNPGGSIEVDLMNDDALVCKITGYVSKMTALQFTKDPEVQIVIECTSPFFFGSEISESTIGLSKSSPSLGNVGSAPTGFLMELTFTGSQDDWTITSSSDATKKMSITKEFVSGDKLIIDTRYQMEGVYVDPVGSDPVFSLLKKFTQDSTWLKLQPGSNGFDTSSSTFDWVFIKYTPQYWGV